MAPLLVASKLCSNWQSTSWVALLIQSTALLVICQAHDKPARQVEPSASRCLMQSGAFEARSRLVKEEVTVDVLREEEVHDHQESHCSRQQLEAARDLRIVRSTLRGASLGLQRGDKAQATEAMEKALMMLRSDGMMESKSRHEDAMPHATPQVQAAAQAQEDGLELARAYLRDALQALAGERLSSGAMLALGKVDIAERTTVQALMDGLRSCALDDVENAKRNLMQGMEEVKAGKRKGALAHIDSTIRALKRAKKVVHLDMGVEGLVQDHLEEAINMLVGSVRLEGDTKAHPPQESSHEVLSKVLTKLKHARYALHMTPTESSSQSNRLDGTLVPMTAD